MDIFWFVTFAVLLAGYFALEGFDIGLGVLLPFLGRSREGRDRLVAAMAPFVLANEVWLVALAGLLFGAFPVLEGRVLSGLYPVVVALLLSWILRDAGLWFRRRADGAAWRTLWDAVLWAGSAGLAVTWGVVLAGVARGLPPAPFDLPGLAAGVVVLALFAFHGRAFAAWRLSGEPTAGDPAAGHPTTGGPRRGGRALLASGLVAALPAVVAMAALASEMLGNAAPDRTLTFLGVIVVPFAPVLVGAQVWVWRAFGRGALPSFF
ncbi:cytochrome d ubiquinol oxidase subunit II [Microbispora sp. RL4-1S]|uniref:Cytochrome d ubiquinol oxidase subunit II n=1 Tax=Microbispora oryzae TaxID=2806554 RepID=A0A940WMB4_9ACTN|nr:cytochrome d ubiquinol oxidase subunit II [Microbispora oryzae]MBP2704085.1 cytochrome d ubiquinol oxidase subunit II [Microbispora oryzae]